MIEKLEKYVYLCSFQSIQYEFTALQFKSNYSDVFTTEKEIIVSKSSRKFHMPNQFFLMRTTFILGRYLTICLFQYQVVNIFLYKAVPYQHIILNINI